MCIINKEYMDKITDKLINGNIFSITKINLVKE